jgi:hypothetical protein
MLQQYIPNVSVVSVLYVAVSVFILQVFCLGTLHMLQMYVPLFHTYVTFKCFMLPEFDIVRRVKGHG